MTAPLSTRDMLFVAAYMKTRDAAVACRDSGISPRKAASMLANPDIQAAIASAEAAGEAPESVKDVSLHSLIKAAQEAYDLARREGNASAMVSAVQLLAKLTGRADGEAPELEPQAEPHNYIDDRGLAMRILFILYRDPAVQRAFTMALQLMAEGGRLVVHERPGETLVSISDPKLAESLGGVRLQPLDVGQPISDSKGVH